MRGWACARARDASINSISTPPFHLYSTLQPFTPLFPVSVSPVASPKKHRGRWRHTYRHGDTGTVVSPKKQRGSSHSHEAKGQRDAHITHRHEHRHGHRHEHKHGKSRGRRHAQTQTQTQTHTDTNTPQHHNTQHHNTTTHHSTTTLPHHNTTRKTKTRRTRKPKLRAQAYAEGGRCSSALR